MRSPRPACSAFDMNHRLLKLWKLVTALPAPGILAQHLGL